MTGPGPLSGGRKSSPVGRSGIHAVLLSGAKLGTAPAASTASTEEYAMWAPRHPASMPAASKDTDFTVWDTKLSLLFLRPSGSEIRLVCLRQRRDLILKKVEIVLGADVFAPFARHPPKPLHRGPGRGEGTRVLDGDENLHHLAAVDQLIALDHVQLIG